MGLRRKASELPDSMEGKCYKNRGFSVYIRILKVTGGRRATCIYLYASDYRRDELTVTVEDVRIDDFEDPEDHIIIREIDEDCTYAYDRITDEEFRKAAQEVFDRMRAYVFGDTN